MADIEVERVNESVIGITCEPHLIEELSQYFTFMAPDYNFSPLYRQKKWDGKIRLFNKRKNQLPAGLAIYLIMFADERKYSISFANNLNLLNSFSLEEAQEFIDSIKLCSKGKPLPIREYQLIGFAKSIRYKRMLLVSPTASGKSLMMYAITRYLLASGEGKRGLIVVPSINLVEQLFTDFQDYSNGTWKVEEHCQKIYGGQSKVIDKNVVISTWQSIYEMDRDAFFSQFDFVIGDEAHNFQARSLSTIMTRLINAKYRIATTGTLDDWKVHKLTIEGHFGPVSKLTTTKKLMDDGHVAELAIKAITLVHPQAASQKMMEEKDYKKEIDFLVENEARNKFLRNLALSLKGNTLVLFQFISHGKELNGKIQEKKTPDRKIFFVFGETEVEQREKIRKIVEQESNAIIIASYGVFSTGVNIKNLHNVIFASPSKSKIRILQSIGRALRLSDTKQTATLYDISDDLRYGKYLNYTLKHFIERSEIYVRENFKLSHYSVELKYA